MKDKKKKRLWSGEFKLKVVIDIMVKSLADLIKTIDVYIY